MILRHYIFLNLTKISEGYKSCRSLPLNEVTLFILITDNMPGDIFSDRILPAYLLVS